MIKNKNKSHLFDCEDNNSSNEENLSRFNQWLVD